MEKILISACLLGDKVRYDGKGKLLNHPLLQKWQEEGRLVPVCPEVCGGLSVPRPAAEIVCSDGSGGGEAVLSGEAKVITRSGQDVTAHFLSGAQHALELCKTHDIKVAILTDRSPSCASFAIHDGSFSSAMVKGVGVTTALLRAHKIKVFGPNRLDIVDDYLFFIGNSVCTGLDSPEGTLTW